MHRNNLCHFIITDHDQRHRKPSGDLIGISGTVIDITKVPRPIPSPHDAQARLKRINLEVMMRRKRYIKPRPEDTYICWQVRSNFRETFSKIFKHPSQA